MFGRPRTLGLCAAGALLVLSAVSASASVVDGCVTYFSGDSSSPEAGCSQGNSVFVKLAVPFGDPALIGPSVGWGSPTSVGEDEFQKPYLFAFDELQNVTVPSAVTVDVGSNLTVGQQVSSQFVFFDPSAKRSLQGWVEFDTAVIGILTTQTDGVATDATYGLSSITYDQPTNGLRGLENGDTATINPLYPNRVYVHFDAKSPGDYIRVFTAASIDAGGPGAVPLPAALPLFATGLGLVSGVGAWRRRKANKT